MSVFRSILNIANGSVRLTVCMVAIIWMILFLYTSTYLAQPNQSSAASFIAPVPHNISQHHNKDCYQNIHMMEHRDSDSVCSSVKVKGMGKSGTSWLSVTLTDIIHAACTKYNLQSTNGSICFNNTVNEISFGRHNIQNSTKLLPLYNETCHFVIFRDPRDRAVSSAFYFRGQSYLRPPPPYPQWKLNRDVVRMFANSVSHVNEWFEVYSMLMRDYPLHYFMLFYEDLVLDAKQSLQQMVQFMGLESVLNEEDIASIAKVNDWHYKPFGSRKSIRKLNQSNPKLLCDFERDLYHDSVLYVNRVMNDNLHSELKHKFECRCPIELDSNVTVDFDGMMNRFREMERQTQANNVTAK